MFLVFLGGCLIMQQSLGFLDFFCNVLVMFWTGGLS